MKFILRTQNYKKKLRNSKRKVKKYINYIFIMTNVKTSIS